MFYEDLYGHLGSDIKEKHCLKTGVKSCRKRLSININREALAESLYNSPMYRLAKATFLLVFLFGLHSILFKLLNLGETGWSKETKDVLRKAEDLSESLSGFIVSIAYCYSNGEVLSVIGENVKRWKVQRFGGY